MRVASRRTGVQVAAIVAAACFDGTSGFVRPLLNYGLRQSQSSNSASASASASVVLCAKALIVQNKGGGHGELGYQLAKLLKDKDEIDSITILQDSKCDMEKEPFKSYATDLKDVKVILADMSDDNDNDVDMEALLEGESYDYVWDNSSKKPEGFGKTLCDFASSQWKDSLKLFAYVSSAGIYQPDANTQFPMDEESTPIKQTAGQHLFDQYCLDKQNNLPYVSFRPQYIYGPKSNKHDYIDWFFDRLERDLPLPIPHDGNQLVSLTNSCDVASILCSPMNDLQSATQQTFFNCGTTHLISYNDLAYACATVMAKDKEHVQLYHYDANLLGKGTFPFRLTDFYVRPDKLQQTLHWEGPQNTLEEDLKTYYEDYQKRGGPTKQMNLGKDWEIVIGSNSQWENGSVYDKYDPLIIDDSNVQPLTNE